MKNLSFLIIASVFSALAYAEPVPQSSLDKEFDPLLLEIDAMRRTDTGEVPDFVVHEATPDRIEKLFQMSEVIQLPMNMRANGLIFAGFGSSLLTFEKPSDIIAKVSAWFPKELDKTRQGYTPPGFQKRFNLGMGSNMGGFYLFGPYENWESEPKAFLSLWNCMPQNAWLWPDQNPFLRFQNDDFVIFPVASQDPGSGDIDFNFCLHKSNGHTSNYPSQKQMRKIGESVAYASFRERLQRMGESVVPLLRDKFASFLGNYRCRGTGPDDCVLILRLWASMMPSDTGLAEMIQSLETDVAPDSPLPELLNPKAGWYSNREDGQDRFNTGLRRAAFLRAKLQSILNAPQAWSADALASALRQLSDLQQAFSVPFVKRWERFYELDYRNEHVNPWRVLAPKPEGTVKVIKSKSKITGELKTAVLAELDSLSEEKNPACEVFEKWFEHGEESLRTEYVLWQMRRSNKYIPKCATPDFEWLRQQTDTEFRYVLYGYLALLDYLPVPEQNALIHGLTDSGRLCAENVKTDSVNWLQQICK